MRTPAKAPGIGFPLLAAILLMPLGPAAADEPPTYERDIKPLLARRCAVCHNAKKVSNRDLSGGLALDTFEAVLRGTEEHRVVIPGKAGESELYRRLVEADVDLRMPLQEDPLQESRRELIRRWIDAGLPRGEAAAPSAATADAAMPARRFVRTLDVVLPVDAKVPKGVEGMGPGGAIEVVLKVGPLPAVSALAFRDEGRLLAVGTAGQVVIWDLCDGRPVATLGAIPGPVHALAFSRDGRRLAVGAGLPARSGVVRVYAIPDGTLLRDFEGHGDVVSAVAIRPDGRQLASASFDQTVRIWDLGDGAQAGVFTGHSDFVHDVSYTADGRALLSASKDRSIKRFDAATATGLRTYSGHDDDVLALAVRPDGSGFVTAGNEPQLRWWAPDGDKPDKVVNGHSGPVHQLGFSGDGRRLISAGGDRSVRLWDGSSGTFQRALAGPTDWQYSAALSGDGRLAAAGGWDGVVRVWDADSGALRATLLQPPAGGPGDSDWLALAPSGYLDGSAGLRELLRWRIGGSEVPGRAPSAIFIKPEHVARSLRGEPVVAAFAPSM